MTTIALVLNTPDLTPNDLIPLVPALQAQVGHAAQLWPGVVDPTIKVDIEPFGKKYAADVWPLYLLTDADVQGALGYHDDQSGQPYGRVFVGTTLKYGYDWRVTTSHEFLEILGDATIDQVIAYQTRRYARELCDPCEDDQFGYVVDGIKVSDFIGPAWFGAAKKGARYDWASHLAKPRTLLSGGYCSYETKDGKWHQLTHAETPDMKKRPGTGGRSSIRMGL